MKNLFQMFKGRLSYILLTVLAACFISVFACSGALAFPYKDYEVDISATLSQVYDSNIYFEKDNETDGFRTDATLSLGIKRTGKRRYFNLDGHITRGVYNSEGNIKNNSESVVLKFGHKFSRHTSLKIQDVFSHSNAPSTFEEEFGRVTGRFDSYRNAFALNILRGVRKYLSVSAAYGNSIRRYDRGTDSDTNTGSIRLRYRPGADKVFFVGYTYGKTVYDDLNDVYFQVITAGAEKYITRRLSFNGSVSLGRRRSENGQGKFTSSIDLSLSNWLDRNTFASIKFHRTDYDAGEGAPSSANWRVSGQIERRITPKLDGAVSGFYGEGKFLDFSGRDEYLGATASLTYQFTEHLSTIVHYTYSKLLSTEEDRGYTRHLAGLGVAYAF
jgi:hypothetical protein